MTKRKRQRKKPTERRTRARSPQTRAKAEEAWRLRIQGKSYEYIGQQLGGMVPSSVHELLAGYVGGRPVAGIEDYRQLLLARLDALYDEALTTLEGEETTKGRCDALRTMRGIVHEAAIISGVVKHAPPVVLVNQFTQGPDLSRLSIEDVEFMKGVQAKLLAPVDTSILVHGEVVEDERNERDEPEGSEGADE